MIKFKSFLSEAAEHEITVGNYTTTHFYMCGTAIKAMTKHKDVDGAEALTKMQDEFFKFEKKFMSSEPNDADKAKAETMFNQIMQKAKAAGIEKDVGSYMKMHRDSITKGDPKPGFGKVNESKIEEGPGKPESWEAGYKRRVVKTTKPEHKDKGYNWRIKGKDRPEISIKLYKSKPSQAEFNKQMKRVAGHEFGG